MGRRLIVMVILACIGSFPVHAGDTFVNGPVSGIWPAGQTIVVDGPIWILEGAELEIENGVHIEFLTLDYVAIDGQLIAKGEFESPITLSVPNGWEGLRFSPNLGQVQILTSVHVGVEGGLPNRVITGSGALLSLNDCRFRAKEICLDVDGGQIRAFGNSFTTTGYTSKTVRFRNLHYGGLNADPCLDAEASTLANGNMLSAIVPDQGQAPGWQIFTTALDVSNCSRLCLDSVYITVDAPCMAIGAHFQYDADIGTPVFSLRHSTVTVRSPRGQPYGLLGTESGTLNVIHCNVDVANPLDQTGFQPNGMSIRGSADMYVNSSIVQIDKGERWFAPHQDATGLITVSYVDKWSLPVSSLALRSAPREGGPGIDPAANKAFDATWNKNAIVETGQVYNADPEFCYDGTWGAWETPEDVRRYYALRQTSPCIDKADTQYGYDPDSTLPDIGQFYFSQTTPVDTPMTTVDDGVLLPLSLELALPFPNPFNAVTVVPFHLSRSGLVNMAVYDLLGRRVAVLASGPMSGGSHTARFIGDNLPSGLYIVSLEFNGTRVGNRPLLLVK